MAQHVYIDLKKLRPGDIILTRPKEDKDSALIALFGWSEYSHSELFVGSCQTYEATTRVGHDKGSKLVGLVGPRWIQDGTWQQRAEPDPEMVRLLGDRAPREFYNTDVFNTDRYDRCEVLRWRDDDEPGLSHFRENIETHCKDLRLRPYATLRELVGAVSLPVAVVARILGRFVDIIPESIGSGLFCSQLVALVYERGGFPLFSDTPPERVSPGRLADCRRLKYVTNDVLVRQDETGEFKPSNLSRPLDEMGVFEAEQRRRARKNDEIMLGFDFNLGDSKDDERRSRKACLRAQHSMEDNDPVTAAALLKEAMRLCPRDAQTWAAWTVVNLGLYNDARKAAMTGFERLRRLDARLAADLLPQVEVALGIPTDDNRKANGGHGVA